MSQEVIAGVGVLQPPSSQILTLTLLHLHTIK